MNSLIKHIGNIKIQIFICKKSTVAQKNKTIIHKLKYNIIKITKNIFTNKIYLSKLYYF